MKKVLGLGLVGILAVFMAYYAFIYFVTYSEGTRSGELIKISNKGVIVKTWEGEISSRYIWGSDIYVFGIRQRPSSN